MSICDVSALCCALLTISNLPPRKVSSSISILQMRELNIAFEPRLSAECTPLPSLRLRSAPDPVHTGGGTPDALYLGSSFQSSPSTNHQVSTPTVFCD